MESSFSLLDTQPLSSVGGSLSSFKSSPSSEASLGCAVGSSWASVRNPFTRGSVEHAPGLLLCHSDLPASLPLQEPAPGSPSCSFRAKISCLGLSLEDPLSKELQSHPSVSGVRRWELLVIFKAKATSVVICLS